MSPTSTEARTQPEGILLRVEDLGHVYGTGSKSHVAIEALDFEIPDGGFVSIVGPSGCGKTTLLKCISGLMPATHGTVWLEGQAIVDVPQELALVLQDYSRSLYPWMTVGRNIAFPLTRLDLDREQQTRRVAESLAAVGLDGQQDRYPWQLSGGMQQRVAIARALAYRPKILLMDEPFASVDAQTRADLEDLLLDVWSHFGMTIVFVTHDVDESVYLSDKVLVLSNPPARVVASMDVPLPRPRNQIRTKEDEQFVHLRAEVTRLIRPNA